MSEIQLPAIPDETHPDVFTKSPTCGNVGDTKPGQLGAEKIKRFFEDGYILLDDFFTQDQLQEAMNDIQGQVEEIAQRLYKGGKIKELYSGHDFHTRLSMLERDFPGANILLHKLNQITDGMKKLWTDDRLLNIMEQLLGTADIIGHPVWNLRTKTPNSDAATVPWHQDVGYLDASSYDVMQVTAWVPLVDANEENGCLQIMRGGHRLGKVAMHTCAWRDTWYIMLGEDEMEKSLGVDVKRDTMTLPVKAGSLILFSNIIPHRSLPNKSTGIRWSLDLRWQRADKPTGFPMDGIQMRSSDKSFKINWEAFTESVRSQKLATALKQTDQDPFDTVMMGPWLKRWPVTHSNRHVERAHQAEN